MKHNSRMGQESMVNFFCICAPTLLLPELSWEVGDFLSEVVMFRCQKNVIVWRCVCMMTDDVTHVCCMYGADFVISLTSDKLLT